MDLPEDQEAVRLGIKSRTSFQPDSALPCCLLCDLLLDPSPLWASLSSSQKTAKADLLDKVTEEKLLCKAQGPQVVQDFVLGYGDSETGGPRRGCSCLRESLGEGLSLGAGLPECSR